MADKSQATERKSQAFIRGAGNVDDSSPIMKFPPARWVVQLIQYMVAIIMLTIGEGFKAIVSGESPKKRRAQHARQE